MTIWLSSSLSRFLALILHAKGWCMITVQKLQWYQGIVHHLHRCWYWREIISCPKNYLTRLRRRWKKHLPNNLQVEKHYTIPVIKMNLVSNNVNYKWIIIPKENVNFGWCSSVPDDPNIKDVIHPSRALNHATETIFMLNSQKKLLRNRLSTVVHRVNL